MNDEPRWCSYCGTVLMLVEWEDPGHWAKIVKCERDHYFRVSYGDTMGGSAYCEIHDFKPKTGDLK